MYNRFLGYFLLSVVAFSSLGVNFVCSAEVMPSSFLSHRVIFISFGDQEHQLGSFFLDNGLETYGDSSTDTTDKPDIAAESSLIEGPSAFNIDEKGNLYFLDVVLNRVSKFDSQGQYITATSLPEVDDLENTYSDLQLLAPDLVFLSDIENNRFILLNLGTGQVLERYQLSVREVESRGDADLNGVEASSDMISQPYYLEDFRVVSRTKLLFRDLYDNSVYSLEKASEQLRVERQVHRADLQLSLYQYSNGAYAGFAGNPKNPDEMVIYAVSTQGANALYSTDGFVGLGFFELVSVENDLVPLAFYQGGEIGLVLRELRLYKADGTLLNRSVMNAERLPWGCEGQIRYRNSSLYVLEYDKKRHGLKIHLLKIQI